MTREEATKFVEELSEETCWYLDLFTHRHIFGLETMCLVLAGQTSKILSDKALRRVLLSRRKIRIPEHGPGYVFLACALAAHTLLFVFFSGDVVVTTGYLSHDYWPSLLCVPEGPHHIRFFNLTNARSDGQLRYYRCSKCCTIKVSASRNIKNRRYPNIDGDFQVPKLQIRNDDVVTDWSALQHFPDCEPTPIPVMLAEQLDRRARRQASLGLLAPREAWTDVSRLFSSGKKCNRKL